MNAPSRSLRIALLYASLLALCVSLMGCVSDRLAGAEHSHSRPRHPSGARDAHAATPTQLPDGLGGLRDRDGALHGRAPHALERTYARLLAIDEGRALDDGPLRVRITQLGDSHTASDTFTGPARALLQERFGAAGRGYLYAGTPWSSYAQRAARYSMSEEWSGGVGIRGGAAGFSLGGARIYAERAGAWMERGPCDRCKDGTAADRITLHYLQQPGGGSFRVLVDGVQVAEVQTHADEESLAVLTFSSDADASTLRVETLDEGRVTLFGSSFEDTDTPGVIYDSLGINGAQLRHFLGFNEAFSHDELLSLQPDLLILAFGANEAMSSRYQVRDPRNQALELLQKLEAYRDEVLTLIARYKAAAPDAECLVMLPPDMLARDSDICHERSFESELLTGTRCVQQPPYNYPGIINAQRFAAMSAGCAVWDQQQAMGGEGAIDIWRELRLAARDGVHLSTSGYTALAERFAQDLIENYEAWRDGDVRPLPTTIIFPELATSARKPD